MSSRLLDLPPLDLLRSFVAAGRQMSITLAAEELCLTQSAVSRQIRALEEVLGYALFVRGHRSIELTNEGKRLFAGADIFMEQLTELVTSLDTSKTQQAVTITASIGVTALWILPWLGNFQLAYPRVDVRVATSNRLINIERENIDLAIRYCKASAAPKGAIHLFDETLAPVAHPSLMVSAIEKRDQLSKQVLLEYDDPGRTWLHWSPWLATAGMSKVKPTGILRFNQYDQVVQAALAGHGVALGRLELIRPLINQGKLVIASQLAPTTNEYAFWLLSRNQFISPHAGTVRDWILAEAAKLT